MSETPKKLSLDAVLREWPELEKSPMDWEQMAQRIDGRVRSGDASASASYVSDENLLAEPLGQIEGEGHNSAATVEGRKTVETRVSKGETMTMPVDRERDRRSLQDLAKMAATGMTPPPPSVTAPHSSAPSGVQRAVEAKKDDSGIVDLAMAAQSDPHAAVRAQSTPLAKDGLFDDEPASVRPGPVSGAMAHSQAAPFSQPQQPAPSIPPFAAAAAGPISQSPLSAPLSMPAPASFAPASQASQASAASSSMRAMPAPQQKKGKGAVIALVFGGLVAASAIAAGGFFFVQQHNAKKAGELGERALNTPAPVAPAVAAQPPEAKPLEAANPAPEPSLDPNALPTATPDSKVAAAPKGAAKGAPLAAAPKNEKPAPAKPEETAKLSQKDLPTAPVGPEGDLGKAMGKAVGADGKPIEATPAAGNTGPQFAAGTVPQKPSQGAVTGAIGAVLPGARQCLGPDDPVSRASITFGSAGTVSSVSVSGGAAGKPAEGCIKAALGKAKVAPFAEATYTANITVRH